MRKTFLAIGLILSAALFVGSYQRAEKLSTVANVAASVGHRDKVMERTVALNMVNITARHCQKYMHDGVLDKIGQNLCASDSSALFFDETNHNLRTTVGGDWQSGAMGCGNSVTGCASQPVGCNFVVISADGTAPAPGDTVVAGELTTNGLGRAQGTYAHTNGTSSFTMQKVFSATGSQAGIVKTGLLNASSSGTLCFENTFSSVSVNNGDTLTV